MSFDRSYQYTAESELCGFLVLPSDFLGYDNDKLAEFKEYHSLEMSLPFLSAFQRHYLKARRRVPKRCELVFFDKLYSHLLHAGALSFIDSISADSPELVAVMEDIFNKHNFPSRSDLSFCISEVWQTAQKYLSSIGISSNSEFILLPDIQASSAYLQLISRGYAPIDRVSLNGNGFVLGKRAHGPFDKALDVGDVFVRIDINGIPEDDLLSVLEKLSCDSNIKRAVPIGELGILGATLSLSKNSSIDMTAADNTSEDNAIDAIFEPGGLLIAVSGDKCDDILKHYRELGLYAEITGAVSKENGIFIFLPNFSSLSLNSDFIFNIINGRIPSVSKDNISLSLEIGEFKSANTHTLLEAGGALRESIQALKLDENSCISVTPCSFENTASDQSRPVILSRSAELSYSSAFGAICDIYSQLLSRGCRCDDIHLTALLPIKLDFESSNEIAPAISAAFGIYRAATELLIDISVIPCDSGCCSVTIAASTSSEAQEVLTATAVGSTLYYLRPNTRKAVPDAADFRKMYVYTEELMALDDVLFKPVGPDGILSAVASMLGDATGAELIYSDSHELLCDPSPCGFIAAFKNQQRAYTHGIEGYAIGKITDCHSIKYGNSVIALQSDFVTTDTDQQ